MADLTTKTGPAGNAEKWLDKTTYYARVVSAILEASTAVIGHVIVDAGSAIIGKVGIDQTTPGTTNGVVATGPVADAVAVSGNPQGIAGIYESSLPNYSTGQAARVHVDSRGRLLEAPATNINQHGPASNTAALITIAAVSGKKTTVRTVTGSNSGGTPAANKGMYVIFGASDIYYVFTPVAGSTSVRLDAEDQTANEAVTINHEALGSGVSCAIAASWRQE
jgi:hypothetical protein